MTAAAIACRTLFSDQNHTQEAKSTATEIGAFSDMRMIVRTTRTVKRNPVMQNSHCTLVVKT